MIFPSASPVFQSVWNEAIQISSPSDERTVRYRHGSSLPKPGVHPIVTPRGHVLTGWEMSDHVWHRGLWFTIKFVNQENFWEEETPFGVQNTTSGPAMETVTEDAICIHHGLQWNSPTVGPVCKELRTVTIRLADDGVTQLDWSTTLQAAQEVTLDRTPFTTWGGYGGFAFRASRELHEAEFLLPDGSLVPAIEGDAHPWVVLQGRMDGGADERVAVGIIDHPQNPVAPVPWYAKSPPGRGFTFLNAAFLFHGPLTLSAGESLRFDYRILCRDGRWTAGEFAERAGKFRNADRDTLPL